MFVFSGTQVDKFAGKDIGNMAPVSIMANRCQCAGARNVLLSLWGRTLNEGNGLWQQFYNNLLSGLGPAASLRKTQLSMIAHGTNTADWAQLQLFGPGY